MDTNLMTETGVSGVASFNGREADRYLPELQGSAGIQTMARILRREPAAYTVANATRLAARQASWRAVPASDAPGDRAAAEFLESCMDDMSSTWWQAISFALSAQAFGFADLHIVYKRRSGSAPKNGNPPSKYKDNAIGIRKLAIRRQETIDRWLLDDNGNHQAMIQLDPSTGRLYPPVPIERLLHFVGGDDRGAWEGMGWLEPAYKIWHMLQGFEIIYGVGSQRSFVGVPVFEYVAKPDAQSIQMVRKMGKALTVSESQFFEYPGEIVKFRLETVTNSNAGELRAQIAELRWLMLMLGLTQFLQLGNTASGSQALASPLITMFRDSVDAANDDIAETINRHLVPRLFALNPSIAAKTSELPWVQPTKINKLRPEILQYLTAIQTFLNGAPNEDAIWLRDMVGMPEMVTNPNTPITTPPDAQPDNSTDTPPDTIDNGASTTGDGPALSARISARELLRMRTATREFARAADLYERAFYAQP